MRKVLVFLSILALSAVLPAAAQMPANSLARTYNIEVKPGMGPQWEAGIKKLNQWSHQHNAPNTYYVWSIISGPRTGQYVLGTFGHNWKDFDAAEKASQGVGKQIQADLAPYTESVETSYWIYRADLSGHPPNPGQGPAAFSTITTFVVKPGDENKVEDAIKQAEAAIQKSHWPGKPVAWYSLVNGGEEPTLLLAGARKNWADFQPPATSFGKMLTNVYGEEKAEDLGREVYSSLRSEQTEILRYRPDLSYLASSQ